MGEFDPMSLTVMTLPFLWHNEIKEAAKCANPGCSVTNKRNGNALTWAKRKWLEGSLVVLRLMEWPEGKVWDGKPSVQKMLPWPPVWDTGFYHHGHLSRFQRVLCLHDKAVVLCYKDYSPNSICRDRKKQVSGLWELNLNSAKFPTTGWGFCCGCPPVTLEGFFRKSSWLSLWSRAINTPRMSNSRLAGCMPSLNRKFDMLEIHFKSRRRWAGIALSAWILADQLV